MMVNFNSIVLVIASKAHGINGTRDRVDVVFYQVFQPMSEHEVNP